MAVIHHGQAGLGQIVPGNLVDITTALHHHARRPQGDQVFDAALIVAAARLGQFGNGAGFAAGEDDSGCSRHPR